MKDMKRTMIATSLLLVSGSLLLVGMAGGPALAQSRVEVSASSPGDPRELELVSPAPGAREVSRPREADFYREDIRVRHDPGFVEPLTTRPKSGPIKKIGLSGWTAPPGRGDGIVQQDISGWFGFGLSIVWE